MRILALITCSIVAAAVVASAGAVEPKVGALSVERGKGAVTL